MTAYNISSYSDLKTIKDDLAGDYTLTADIDASASKNEASGAGFLPIGTAAAPFTGTLDGGGFTISNLFINRGAMTDGVGLFGSVISPDGFIKDLKLTNFRITTPYYVGLLGGALRGTSGHNFLVSNCSVEGTITSLANGTAIGGFVGDSLYVAYSAECFSSVAISATAPATAASGIGGFVGHSQNSTYANCHSHGTIETTGAGTGLSIGGFIGNSPAAVTNTFTSCYSLVGIVNNAITSGSSGSYIGGFVGIDSASGTYLYCYAIGLVLSSDTFKNNIGGFVGYSLAPSIKQCAAFGDVECTSQGSANEAKVGGFIGNGTCIIENCFCRGDVCKQGISSGTYRIGGFAGEVYNGSTTNAYSSGYVYPASGAGGFIGKRTTHTCTLCKWDKTTSGFTTGVGTSGVQTGVTGNTTAEMKTLATFTGWDFNTIWQLIAGTAQSAITASNLTCWLSETGDYDNFEDGVKDADSFQQNIATTNEIRWIDSQESLLIGTAGDEWKLASNKLETPLSPTNTGSKRQTGHGSAYIQAVQVNEVILFVDFVKRKVREMTHSPDKNKYVCPDMTAMAEHITEGKIKWVAYQKNPDSILWVGLETGEVRGFVYDREENVLAWYEINLGGNPVVQSGCVIPGETEDEIHLIVNRTIAGTTIMNGDEVVLNGTETVVNGGGDKVYLEKFSARELTEKADSFFVDCGITFETPGDYVDHDIYNGTELVLNGTEQVVHGVFDSAVSVSTITGLDHLNGETVQILGDGIVLDEQVVADGEVSAELNGVATPVLKAQIGKANTPLVQPMRIVLGDSMGSITHVPELVISFANTGAAKYGKKPTELHDIDFSDIRWENSCEIDGLFTGEVVVSMPGGFSVLNPIYISSDSPLPITVRAIIARIDRTGR